MLFKCFRCGLLSFYGYCNTCGGTARDDSVSQDPKYFPELRDSPGNLQELLQDRLKGLQRELESLDGSLDVDSPLDEEWNRRMKAKIELGIRAQMEGTIAEMKKAPTPQPTVPEKYKEFERPYFVNFVHLVGREAANSLQSDEDTNLILFQEVLVRLGFEQLNEFPGLTRKLVLSTMLRMDYSEFVAQNAHHISGRLESTLRSWIEERGAFFRSSLTMLLYYLWEKGLHSDEICFSAVIPLVHSVELKRVYDLCEQIYLDIEVSRLQLTLENFDPSSFITMYTLDGMQGYEFEEFLGNLFKTIGFDVQVTKRSGDQGADLFAERFGKKIVIQAKNYSDSVGNSAIQQVLAAKLFYGCDEAMVITNSYFTSSAIELADATGVRLVDRAQLQVYLDEYNQTMAQGCKASSLSQED